MSWFRREPRLTESQHTELQACVERLNGILTLANEAWVECQPTVAPLYAVAKRAQERGEGRYPLSSELLVVAQHARLALSSYLSTLQTLAATFAEIQLPAWSPNRYAKHRANMLRLFFGGQIGFLPQTIVAIEEPDPLVDFEGGPYKVNMFRSGLNTVAMMQQTLRLFPDQA